MRIVSAFFMVYWTSVTAKPFPPFNLKCEKNQAGLSAESFHKLDKHMVLGIDNPNPVFSWTLRHSDRAARQSAFQLVVYKDRALSKLVWDSGKVYHQTKSTLQYTGPDLQTGRTYFWQVQWWDHNGESALSEEIGYFLVGVLDPNTWDIATWITAGASIQTAPFIHNTFTISSSRVVEASLFVSGLGFSKPFVNGVDLNERYDPPVALTPGWSNYENMVPYTAYDVSDLAKKNSSLTVGVMLGVGWRNTEDYTFLDDFRLVANDTTERVLKVLFIVHYDDFSMTFVSNESWKADETYIAYDSIYSGETFRYKKNEELVMGSKVEAVNGPNGDMYLPNIPYIAEVAVETPAQIYHLYDDRGFITQQIVDFYNNTAGYCRVYSDVAGMYELQFSEVALHEPYGKKNGSLYFGSNRDITVKDVFFGESNYTYKPSFTYHGFRYVQVQGIDALLTDKNIQKIVIHSNVRKSSKFESSIPILNRIQDACMRSQLSNLMSIITDCPQRDERLGWLGDASQSAQSIMLNFDMQAFYYHTLKLIKSEIVDGTIPDVVPYYRYGSRPADPTWSAAYPELLYRLVKISENADVAKEFFPSAVEYVLTTIGTIPPEGIGHIPNCHYGDFIPATSSHTQNNSFTGAFSFLNNMKQLIELADMLEQTADAEMLRDLYDTYSDQFNKGFMTSENKYLEGYQESYVLPLALGVVPPSSKAGFVNNFLNSLKRTGHTPLITGGIVTTRHIFQVLSQLEQHDIALEIAERTTYPSHGFMLHNFLEPSTTLWELWDVAFGFKNSRNHHMFSSISGWLLTDMAGLSLEKGYDEIHFHPARALGLSYASVSLENPKPVSLTWRRSGGVQCAKQVENRSPLNPNLPLIEDLTVSCGHEDGGTIAEVLFASYGNPEGHCGGYYRMGSCHAPQSVVVVEKLCLGRRSCTVPTGADFWDNSCSNSSRWLIVSVQCKSDNATLGEEEFIYSSIAVNVSVPMGSRGLLHLPTHGKLNMMLLEGGNIAYSESVGPKLVQVQGILSSRWSTRYKSLMVELDSGDYKFTWKGDNPPHKHLDSRFIVSGDVVVLQCNSTDSGLISAINWASYGNPEVHNGPRPTYLLGNCHAGSSKLAMERHCLGEPTCVVHLNESFFGTMNCSEPIQKHLIVDYSCNFK